MIRHLLLLFAAIPVYCQSLNAQEFDDLNNQAYKERDSKNYSKKY